MRFEDLLAAVRFVLRTMKVYHTEILHVHRALIPQPSVVNCYVTGIGNRRPIATLCDSQPMDREFGGLRNLLEDF
jgi:hypothetical protein